MIICIDIGGSGIKAALASSPSALTPLGRVPTPLDAFGAFVAAIRDIAGTADAPADTPIAISITGVVDPADGSITCANIPCIDGRRLSADLVAELGRPVFVANDADCFALAEASEGAGRGHRIVFGAILGTGVGGGIVIDGRIVTGAGGFAGEWGHGPVAATSAGDPPVAIPRFACGCGQAGCVDTVGAARGMERLHKHLHGVELPSTAIVDAWRAGDARAARTIEVQIDLLAGPLALVVNVLGASIVPVGGGLGKVPEFIALLDAAVRQRILRRLATPLVVPARLTLEPGLVGAAILGFVENAA
ncbi:MULTISPECIES: ROK family protein [unclassified Devosia]|jgi:N-acetylglucosamine kinase|uniref:ROK family protein n=1 Tax=unclassified Devosia TaxID=196773 RepID=UPI00086E4591|nr:MULTISPECIES: ROK family protein [unclassified Devosia]MBN9362642.1 ROK family protein [Devosia sp.]ODS81822.1 MAG: N-acetylglucosamine kinase [Devosia sp. SCN 66-27]OJX23830.1 MAG: N-acetylglucosamine kinase [Devosia sp. 66-14]